MVTWAEMVPRNRSTVSSLFSALPNLLPPVQYVQYVCQQVTMTKVLLVIEVEADVERTNAQNDDDSLWLARQWGCIVP